MLAADVVINEIMYNTPSQDWREEYIELFNMEPDAVDLSGWEFTKGVNFVFPAGTILESGQFLVVAADVSRFVAEYGAGIEVVGGWQGRLSNSGEEIKLEDASGDRVDRVTYADEGDWALRRAATGFPGYDGWRWVAEHDGGGKSLELRNPALTNRAGHNWAASEPGGGTPGLSNSVATTDVPPLIRDVAHFPEIPRSSQTVTVSAKITDEQPDGVEAVVFYRDATRNPGRYQSAKMYDDGLHGDGAADDGVYAAELPARPRNTVVEFYVRAEDATGNVRSLAPPTDAAGSQGANLLYLVTNTALRTTQPFYHLVFSEEELALFEQIQSRNPSSNAEMNVTFISSIEGEIEIRYNVGVRIRGNGSRGRTPKNFRVNFRNDDLWNGVRSLNLNTQYTQSQVIGMNLFTAAGLVAPEATPVQIRVNTKNLASRNSPQFTAYAQIEVFNGEWAENHLPGDSNGNLYRGMSGDLRYRGESAGSYRGDYTKQTNTSDDDWSDLIGLTRALDANQTPARVFPETLERVANVQQWLRFFAVNALLVNEENGLINGRGDDYALATGVIDSRFQLVPHDMDTVLGQGDSSFSVTRDIFEVRANPLLARIIDNPIYRPYYFAHLKNLAETVFSAEQINPLIDDLLGGWVSGSTIAAMKTFAAQRAAYVLSRIPRGTPDLLGPQRHLRVTEIMFDPPGGSDYEFIELQNTGPDSLNLRGVEFSEGIEFTFPEITLLPDEYVVVVKNQAAFESRYGNQATIAGEYSGKLSNGGERLLLRQDDPLPQTILDFEYSDVWYRATDGEGSSLIVFNAGAEASLWSDVGNWRASNLSGGTPGEQPYAYQSGTIVINEVSPSEGQPSGDWIELHNTSESVIDLEGHFLSDDPLDPTKYAIPADTEIAAGGFVTLSQVSHFGFNLSDGAGQLILTAPSGAGVVDQVAYGAADSGVSFGRFETSTGRVDFVAQREPTPTAINAFASVGPVVIHEIMFHPTDGDYEFIELRNISESEVVLFDASRPEANWKFSDGIEFEFPSGSILPAGGYLVVVGFDPMSDTALTERYRADRQIPENVVLYGPFSSGALSNGGEALELVRPGEATDGVEIPYIVVDRVDYDDVYPWPIEADGAGAALARRSGGLYGDDPQSWEASKTGGTPGADNRLIDRTSPDAPVGLTATITPDNQIRLTWTQVVDPESGIDHYRIYRNGRQIGTSTSTEFLDTTAFGRFQHRIQVTAVNGDHIEGSASDHVAVELTVIEAAWSTGTDLIHLAFSRPLNRLIAEEIGSYETGGIAVQQATLDPTGHVVTLRTSPLVEGKLVVVNVDGLATEDGQSIPMLTARIDHVARQPGWLYRAINSASPVKSLGEAMALFDGPPDFSSILVETQWRSSEINFTSEASVDGRFLSGSSWPSELQPAANLVARTSGVINVPSGEGGDWTFGVRLSGEQTPQTLIAARSQWRYLDDGSDLGLAWQAPNFPAESLWEIGVGPLGYGQASVVTHVGFGQDPNDRNATTYFRSDFEVEQVSRVRNLLFRVSYDDAIAVYLNGTEVVRENIPIDAAFDDYASSAADDNGFSFQNYNIDPGLLIDGKNVIAVEVHQDSPRGSDLRFDLAAIATIGDELAGLRIDGSEVIAINSGDDGERISTLGLASGEHFVELVYANETGASAVELFVARGSYSDWQQTDKWRLVGNSSGGGLAVTSEPLPPASIVWQSVGPTVGFSRQFSMTETPLQVGETLRYETFLTDGQTMSLAVSPTLAESRSTITVLFEGEPLVSASADAAGGAALLQNVVVSKTGLYRIVISSDLSTGFQITGVLNAALDEGTFSGEQISTLATAQSIEMSRIQLSDSGDRLAVLGRTVTADSYESAIAEDEPTAYWKLNESSGGTAIDAGSANLSGFYFGSVELAAPGIVSGGAITAARFDGQDDRIEFAPHPDVNSGGPYLQRTVELWFTTDDVQRRQLLFKEGNHLRGLNIYLDGGNIYAGAFFRESAGATTPWGTHFVSAPVSAAETHQIVFVFDQVTDLFEAFLDGNSIGQATGIGQLFSHNTVAIGAKRSNTFYHDGESLGNGEYFQGTISEISLYNRALSPDRVAAHFDVGANPVAKFFSFDLTQGQRMSALLQTESVVPVSMRLYDDQGSRLAVGVPAGATGNAINQFVATTGGTFFLAVSSTEATDFLLQIGADIELDIEPNNSIAEVQDITRVATALGAIDSPEDVDFFSFDATIGDALVLQTSLAGVESGLRTQLQLFGPSGELIATSDNGGLGSRIEITAEQVGTYSISVGSSQDAGNYLLSVKGHSGATPHVLFSTPPADASLSLFPESIAIQWSDVLDMGTLDPQDLTVQGFPAIGVELIDGRVARFTLDPNSNVGDGTYDVMVSRGAVQNLSGESSAEYSSRFRVDSKGPRVLSIRFNDESLPVSHVIGPGPLSISAAFDEPLLFPPDAEDVSLFEAIGGQWHTPDFVSYSANTRTIEIGFDELPEGVYIFTLDSEGGTFDDLVGNHLDGELTGTVADGTISGDGTPGGNYSLALIVKSPNVNLDDQWQSLGIPGSFVYQVTHADDISYAGDRDLVNFEVERGQSLAVRVLTDSETAGGQLRIRLLDPVGSVVAEQRAEQPGSAVVLHATEVKQSGRYTVEVSGDVAGDKYRVDVLRNGDWESNLSTIETPDDLDTSVVAVGGGVATIIGNFASLPELPGAYFATQRQFETLYSPNVLTLDFGGAPAPLGNATLVVAASGDLNGIDEFITISAEGIDFGRFFEAGSRNPTFEDSDQATIEIPLDQILQLALDGQITFTVTPSDTMTDHNEVEMISLTLSYPSAAEELILVGSPWEFRDDIENGDPYPIDAQNDAWNEPGFDAFWSTGTALLGYGEIIAGTIATELSFGDDPENKRRTYLFRRQFEVAQAAAVNALEFSFLADDSAAIYINGTEVLRRNLPGVLQDGSLATFTMALTVGNESTYESESINLQDFPGLLTDGINTIAVEVHQATPNSSDLGFDLGLRAVLSDSVGADKDYYAIRLGDLPDQSLDVVLAGVDGLDLSGAKLELLSADAQSVLATASAAPLGAPATNYDLAILGFFAPKAGDYLLRLTAEGSGTYALFGGRDIVFDTEPNQISGSPLRSLLPSISAIGALDQAVDTFDLYSITVEAGTILHIETETPFDTRSPASLGGGLDPFLLLYDPTGTPVAGDANSAPDGKNARLVYSALQTGQYVVQVSAASGAGDYLLRWSDASDVVELTDIRVSGSTWNEVFQDVVSPPEDGVPGVSVLRKWGEPLLTIGWSNVDQITISSDTAANISEGDLTLRGVRLSEYPVAEFSRSVESATWQFAQPLVNDRFWLELSGSLAESQSESTGSVRFDALAGDFDRNGVVETVDFEKVFRRISQEVGDPNYDSALDVDGSGTISLSDAIVVRDLRGAEFAVGNPGVAPVAGDMNFDTDVDRLDFVQWSRRFGMTGGATKGDGDFDGDGAVGIADLMILQSQFGIGRTVVNPGASPGSPPSGVVLSSEAMTRADLVTPAVGTDMPHISGDLSPSIRLSKAAVDAVLSGVFSRQMFDDHDSDGDQDVRSTETLTGHFWRARRSRAALLLSTTIDWLDRIILR